MKKLFSILLLSVFLYNIIGFYPVFLLRQNFQRKQILDQRVKRIDTNRLTVLKLTSEQIKTLKWIAEDEFFFEGELYDVVTKSSGIDGNIDFYCLCDVAERKLYILLGEDINNQIDQNNTQSGKDNSLAKNLLKDYLATVNIKLQHYSKLNGYNVHAYVVFDSFIPDKPSPPPKKV